MEEGLCFRTLSIRAQGGAQGGALGRRWEAAGEPPRRAGGGHGAGGGAAAELYFVDGDGVARYEMGPSFGI